MPAFDILHPDRHAQLKVDTERLLSDDAFRSDTPITPGEIAQAQKEFTLVFKKHPDTGAFYTCAILGLTPTDNVFLRDNAWLANFKPASIARGPFLIGMQKKDGKPFPVIGVDENHLAITTQKGEPLFLDNHQPSAFTHKINQLLADFHSGLEADKAMIADFLKYDLIEPFNCSLTVNDTTYTLDQYYAINTQKMGALSAQALDYLNRKNILSLAFFMASSLSNLQKLAELKQK